MKENFNKAFEIVTGLEGGYSDNPDDLGGETKYGICKRGYPYEDIENMTLDRAKEIYYKDYWSKCKCDDMPSGIDIVLFDCAVNQGQVTAIKLLQKSLGVPVDGRIGVVTINGAKHNPDAINGYFTERAFAYIKLNSFNTFGKGWLNRLFRLSAQI
jgi:lysozyme family protein